MSRLGLQAQVWPSALALSEELACRTRQSPGGLLLTPPLFTLEGLLAQMLDRLDLPAGARPLSWLAGAMLVQELLAEYPEIMDSYAGLAAGWRLPHRLWRLLTEVKAAGFDSQQLAGLAGPSRPGITALARLMERYQERLAQKGLWDQADCLDHLCNLLAQGQRAEIMAHWQGLQVVQALWLRAMDLRLLRALAQAIPVKINMCIVPPLGAMGPLVRLIEATAQALESDLNGRLELGWLDLPGQGGPLAGLALDLLDPGAKLKDPGGCLEILQAGGRYSEAEMLVRRALRLMEQGVEPGQIALVFPDLGLYGQMVADLAGRLGLPLALDQGLSLAQTPLVQALLGLIRLPLNGYGRSELAAIWDSPYLGPALGRVLKTPVPRGTLGLLAQAGYVDGQERPAHERLRAAAKRAGPQAKAMGDLAQACQGLQGLLQRLGLAGKGLSLAQFSASLLGLLEQLDLPQVLAQGAAATPPAPPALLARDLRALQGLVRALEELSQAAAQVASQRQLSLGRLLMILESYLSQDELSLPGQEPQGIKVLPLAQALGLKLHTVLIGGLNLGDFPARPQGQHLLSASERLALGRASPQGLPVWRTEDEEYGGQVLNLIMLIASAQAGVVLSSAAADTSGKERRPCNILASLTERLGYKVQATQGGVYGQVPELEQCLEPSSLWARLAANLLNPARSEAELAQATLYSLMDRPQAQARWLEIAGRGLMERSRDQLNLTPNAQRASLADSYNGRLDSAQAGEMLGQILDQDQFRRLSPTSLETYAACPMAWLFGWLLKVRALERPGWELEPAGEGRLVHLCLRRFFAPEEFDPSWHKGQRRERLAQCLEMAIKQVLEHGEPGHPLVWQARRQVIETSLNLVIEREWEEFQKGLRPIAVEHTLEPGVKVELADSSGLVLSGRVDRLDQGPKLIRVTDYKHTKKTTAMAQALKPEFMASTQFQMPIYLAGAEAEFQTGQDSLEGRLVNTHLPRKRVEARRFKPDDPLLTRDPKTRATLAASDQPNLYNAINEIWQRMLNGDYIATPEKDTCRNCDYQLICRASILAQDSQGES